MKLKLTPELFILQDVSQPPESSQHANGQEEEEEKTEAIVLKNPIDLDLRLKQINRTKRFVEAPEFQRFKEEHFGPSQSSPFKSNHDRPCNLLNQNELNQNKAPPNKQQQQQQQFRKPTDRPPTLSAYLPHLLYSLEQNLKDNRIPCDKRVIKRRPTRDIIQSDIRCVTLNKEKFGSGFGLTIKGGIDCNKPLVISGIQRGSAADKCRSLFAGDLIVQLNGQPTYPLRLTHEQAMKTIKTGGQRLYLTVKHLTMYNRPIGRIWHRQLNTFWLQECDNKAEVADWPGANRNSSIINTSKPDSPAPFVVKNQFSSNKSSSQESYTIQTPLSSNQDHLSDSEQYSNCGTATLSNLTVTDKDKDDPLLTPSPHDEGVFTGLSNDALSSSECTSDASGFSSDYTQQSHGQQPTDHRNLCSSNHQPNQNSSSYLQRDPPNEINCSPACSSPCKNRTNNNCCTKCIVNKNHPAHLVNTCFSSQRPADLPDSRTMNSISQERFAFKEPAAERSALNGFAFRSTGKNKQEQSCGHRNNSNEESLFQRSQAAMQPSNNQGASSCSCSLSSSSAASRNSNRTSLVDIVSVSLINCFFTKYISNTDSLRRNGMEVQWFSSHNQSTTQSNVKRRSAEVNSAVISFNDADLAQQFQQKINHYLSKLNESYMFSFSRGLRPQERILYMGWVSLALPKNATGTSDLKSHSRQPLLDYKWQPKYLIIRGGELLLYDCVPDYLLDKLKQVPYANDTLIEFNELSRLLVNQNGALACSITLNNNLNRPKSNSRKSARLTRHLSIRGRDSSLDPSHRFHIVDSRSNGKTVLSETSNSKRSSNGNRLISTLTRNLSLKTAKENRYNKQPANKPKSANPHCTLPRNALIDRQGTSSQLFERNLKRTGAESNLLRTNDFDLLNQQADRQADAANCQPQDVEWENKVITFKAYQSVLRQLKPDEQLDKRENCLLALTTTQSDCATSFNSMSTFRKQSINRSTGELQENSSPNAWYGSRKGSLDEQRQSASSSSLVAYLSVEHAENIPQILKSWNVCTMHSVIKLSVSSCLEKIGRPLLRVKLDIS